MVSLGKRLVLNTVILILISLVCFGSVGCSQTNDDSASPGSDTNPPDPNDADTPLCVNNYLYGDPAPIIWLCYTVPKNRYVVGENVDVELYYEPFYVLPYMPKRLEYCKISMEASNENDEIVENRCAVVREYDDFSTEYFQEYNIGTNGLKKICANEKITVPAEWFSENEGYITFRIEVELPEPLRAAPSITALSFAICLNYIKNNDNTIRLFSE